MRIPLLFAVGFGMATALSPFDGQVTDPASPSNITDVHDGPSICFTATTTTIIGPSNKSTVSVGYLGTAIGTICPFNTNGTNMTTGWVRPTVSVIINPAPAIPTTGAHGNTTTSVDKETGTPHSPKTEGDDGDDGTENTATLRDASAVSIGSTLAILTACLVIGLY